MTCAHTKGAAAAQPGHNHFATMHGTWLLQLLQLGSKLGNGEVPHAYS